jgi:hypothetical protein
MPSRCHRPSRLAPCRGRVGFSGIGRSTPMACEDGGLETPGGGSRPVDRLPSIGVSLQPAIPRRVAPQQSPLPLHQSPTIIPQIPVRRGNQIARLNRTAGMQSRSRSSCPPRTRVSSLLCAPGVISILRRHDFCLSDATQAKSALRRGSVQVVESCVTVEDHRSDPGEDEHADNDEANAIKIVVQRTDAIPEAALKAKLVAD